ncbi:TCP-1/cpn60 chaperonin family protein [Bacillus sp. OK048]|uniref:TCP-1/cpn60 chaperonin family protein n=1 Tax=Bacillus sp. OK048 TaxID=1882761 RepID=UPI001587348D|nr:TCP-1/cpn60 chaperonin family protein [Bacillus sp. OK048]
MAAIEEGIVVGGGTALLQVLPEIREQISHFEGDRYNGAQVVLDALTTPLITIANNCGLYDHNDNVLTEYIHFS